ncbi:hypothetical protein GTA08_BOTSDO12582 [Neofusicoccum parvum]|uniref:Uncharacterized protein n=1 Tax=Neofusicoccum parvum TaxID=310453 RepID=A0ACB5SCY6_9PEZI|nr:hypothetical protein GTA08_BOTSDO12582 [Neofusicoccum parvum]
MDGLPFANAKDLLPRVANIPAPIAANVPRVRTPVPDVTFGLSDTAFARQQLLAMIIPPTSSVCEPISSLYWPFFVLEYKAQAKGGSIYVVVNQCAGSGSACIKAQAKLKTPADHIPLAFSYAIDDRTAELLVHHLDESTKYYVSTVHRYLLADPLHLEHLHRHIHNIIDWGVSSYRDSICRMLDAQ